MRSPPGPAFRRAIAFGAALVLAHGMSALGAQTVRGEQAAEVDAVFAAWDRTDRPGAAVVVVDSGRIVHMDGYGMADLEQGVPITTSTVFDIASVSKHFTGWAVAGLEADGRLSIDEPIDTHLPEIPAFGETITVWHLLHHTSGIRDWVELFAVAGWRFDDVITVPDILTLARHQNALNFRPGTAYAYSNTAYNLLAEIVARITGASFRDHMEEHAFRPLGMHQTHVHDVYNEIVPQRARSYAPLGENGGGSWELWVDNTSAVGSSSVFTSVADMAKWMVNLDSGAVGGSRRLELMLQPTVLENGDTVAYGYGVSLGTYRGLRTVSHGGGWRGYRTHLLRFPDEGLSVAVFANFSTFGSQETARKVAEVFLEDRMAAAAPEDEGEDVGSSTFFEEAGATASTPPAEGLSRYVGRYYSEELGTFYTVEREGERLMLRHRVNEDRALTWQGSDTFTAPGVRGEQTLSFQRDEDGGISGYELAGRRFRGVVFRRMPGGS